MSVGLRTGAPYGDAGGELTEGGSWGDAAAVAADETGDWSIGLGDGTIDAMLMLDGAGLLDPGGEEQLQQLQAPRVFSGTFCCDFLHAVFAAQTPQGVSQTILTATALLGKRCRMWRRTLQSQAVSQPLCRSARERCMGARCHWYGSSAEAL